MQLIFDPVYKNNVRWTLLSIILVLLACTCELSSKPNEAETTSVESVPDETFLGPVCWHGQSYSSFRVCRIDLPDGVTCYETEGAAEKTISCLPTSSTNRLVVPAR